LAAARRCLKPELTIEQFFDSLNVNQIRYVVLRWFEQLPEILKGEDIDLLIHDGDLKKIKKYFSVNKHANSIPFDLYSESGLPGSNYAGIPYFPPHLASSILKERVIWAERYYVPSSRHHFLSMAYHVVYHKGRSSGIPLNRESDPGARKGKHNYLEVLKGLAKKNNINIKLNLLDLHQYLTDKKWRPSINMIKKLGPKRAKLVTAYLPFNREELTDGELMVFIVREWALKNGYIPLIIEWLKNHGLKIILELSLDAEKVTLVKKHIRGGNWHSGLYKVSGGKPAMLLTVYDPKSIPVSGKKKQYPYVTNGHFFLKEKLRKVINSNLPADRQANFVHSSDDEWEAWEFLRIACPELIPAIKKRLENI
jgi:hypothetical protein